MLWIHPAHPGRAVRLAYCMNLHAGATVGEIREGIEAITLPLRDRLAGDRPFGVGAYLPGAVAAELAADGGSELLDELSAFFAGEGLDAFTFNAFPHGGFHSDGLKERVYAPTWLEPERETFTVQVARIAARLQWAEGAGHVSISTHAGGFGEWMEGPADLHRCAEGMGRVVAVLAALEERGGPRVVLSVEAEPRSSANDSRALAEYLVVARTRAAAALRERRGLDAARAADLAARHLGTCLDCCHSAVELEDPREALRLSRLGGPLGKLQFSSAVAVRNPARNPDARRALLAMDEPRYLHQVTGRSPAGAARATDLPDLARALEEDPDPWLACDEWRCHFHVPVDLEEVAGLATTRAHADAILLAALEDPTAWTTDELHVEIETYTWGVLPARARGSGALVDGLEREYRHVMAVLERAGWTRPA